MAPEKFFPRKYDYFQPYQLTWRDKLIDRLIPMIITIGFMTVVGLGIGKGLKWIAQLGKTPVEIQNEQVSP